MSSAHVSTGMDKWELHSIFRTESRQTHGSAFVVAGDIHDFVTLILWAHNDTLDSIMTWHAIIHWGGIVHVWCFNRDEYDFRGLVWTSISSCLKAWAWVLRRSWTLMTQNWLRLVSLWVRSPFGVASLFYTYNPACILYCAVAIAPIATSCLHSNIGPRRKIQAHRNNLMRRQSSSPLLKLRGIPS